MARPRHHRIYHATAPTLITTIVIIVIVIIVTLTTQFSPSSSIPNVYFLLARTTFHHCLRAYTPRYHSFCFFFISLTSTFLGKPRAHYLSCRHYQGVPVLSLLTTAVSYLVTILTERLSIQLISKRSLAPMVPTNTMPQFPQEAPKMSCGELNVVITFINSSLTQRILKVSGKSFAASMLICELNSTLLEPFPGVTQSYLLTIQRTESLDYVFAELPRNYKLFEHIKCSAKVSRKKNLLQPRLASYIHYTDLFHRTVFLGKNDQILIYTDIRRENATGHQPSSFPILRTFPVSVQPKALRRRGNSVNAVCVVLWVRKTGRHPHQPRRDPFNFTGGK